MSIFKVKLRSTDRLFTKYKRLKENYTCQKCGREYLPDNCRNLGVSHYHGRSHENVRFDEDNTLCMCNLPCHRYLDQHKGEYTTFMLNRLGGHAMEMLELRAHIRKKRDDKADAIIIRQMIKELEDVPW